MRSILKGLTGGGANSAADEADYGDVAVIRAGDAARRLQVLDEFEQAGMGWIWATDAEGRLIYLSDNATEKLGRPVEQLLAQPLVALFEIDPDNPDERSDRPLNFQLNARSKLHDLTVKVIEKPSTQGRGTWWSISGHPKFDKGGRFQGYRGSAKDITVEYERKLVDSRLATPTRYSRKRRPMNDATAKPASAATTKRAQIGTSSTIALPTSEGWMFTIVRSGVRTSTTVSTTTEAATPVATPAAPGRLPVTRPAIPPTRTIATPMAIGSPRTSPTAMLPSNPMARATRNAPFRLMRTHGTSPSRRRHAVRR